jgi:hypothetical protein
VKLVEPRCAPPPPRPPSPELERREFTCDRCGYGAVACIAPPRCPMCGGFAWTAGEAQTTWTHEQGERR